uniref:Uncharacterized protein n=1 Tax=Chlamydia pneumoniae TaxID=83558 RepID=A0A0F7X4C4_CHLPN|nr:hypothetical protein BN1224_MUL2216_C_00140 [Chlamydia pneumoniae]
MDFDKIWKVWDIFLFFNTDPFRALQHASSPAILMRQNFPKLSLRMLLKGAFGFLYMKRKRKEKSFDFSFLQITVP